MINKCQLLKYETTSIRKASIRKESISKPSVSQVKSFGQVGKNNRQLVKNAIFFGL